MTATTSTRSNVRGSSLLLVGRLLSVLVNFATQVVIARVLVKSEFAAFAYALAIVASAEAVIHLGLDRAVPRFVAMWDEQRDLARMRGALIVQLTATLTIGLCLVLVVLGTRSLLAGEIVDDGRAVTLLSILIVLAPLQALDDACMGVFAVFAKPKAIFFRRYVFAPGLRLVVVVLLAIGGGDGAFLAAGYVVAGALGVVAYGAMLLPLLRDRGLLHRRPVHLPVRQLFGFGLPLMSSDLVYFVVNALVAVLLARSSGADAVGALRVVQPLAMMNQLAMSSFTPLFTPMAARLQARGDGEGLDSLYWQVAVWMAVLSFPVVLATVVVAEPLTTLFFGAQYQGSAPYLAVLSLGFFFQSSTGFNGLTVQVAGHLRWTIALNVVAAAIGLALALLLIPAHGALGAALATSLGLVAHNLLKQVALGVLTPVRAWPRDVVPVYAAIAVAGSGAAALAVLLGSRLLPGLGVTAAASFAVLALARRQLDLAATFPELGRLGPLARVLGHQHRR